MPRGVCVYARRLLCGAGWMRACVLVCGVTFELFSRKLQWYRQREQWAQTLPVVEERIGTRREEVVRAKKTKLAELQSTLNPFPASPADRLSREEVRAPRHRLVCVAYRRPHISESCSLYSRQLRRWRSRSSVSKLS